MTRRVMMAAATAALAAGTIGCDRISPPGMGAEDAPPPPPVTASRPPAPATAPSASAAPSEDDPATIEFLGLSAAKPATWQWRQPTSGMRLANYDVPDPDGGSAAELIVFYFGPDQGGSNEANIARWAGQFMTPDGGPVEPVVTETVVDGLPVTLVELAGHYQATGRSSHAPDQLLLAAIVESPRGNVFLRLAGPRAAVEHHRAAFDAVVSGLRRTDKAG